MTTIEKACAYLDEIKELLKRKNAAYGDSVTTPLRIFSKASASEGLRVRIDDKLSRIARGKDTERVPEDTRKDLIGYLVLDAVIEDGEIPAKFVPKFIPSFDTMCVGCGKPYGSHYIDRCSNA